MAQETIYEDWGPEMFSNQNATQLRLQRDLPAPALSKLSFLHARCGSGNQSPWPEVFGHHVFHEGVACPTGKMLQPFKGPFLSVCHLSIQVHKNWVKGGGATLSVSLSMFANGWPTWTPWFEGSAELNCTQHLKSPCMPSQCCLLI